MYNRWVDTHCHFLLDFSTPEHIKSMLEGLKELEFAVFISTAESDFNIITQMIQENKNLYGTLGIHPDSAIEANDAIINQIESLTNIHSKILAIGEIGLDYYRNKDLETVKIQKKAFEMQIELAIKLNKPIVIHARDAIMDCLSILKNYSFVKDIVFHCFTGELKEAEAIIDEGYWISYTGGITYPKNSHLRAAVAITPKDKIMVETDSPFFSPVPYRGKQNHPHWVSFIGEQVAQVKGWSIEEAKNITTQNAYRFFGI